MQGQRPLSQPAAERSRETSGASPGWSPRRRQEDRLGELEDRLAGGNQTIDLEIERAVLLNALERPLDAKQAFIDILRKAPENFSALNEFGTLLFGMGMIAAACRVYAEAIAHHPDNPVGHVNLANILLRANKLAEAKEHYEIALRIDPAHPQAHQGLGAVLSDLGDHAAAKRHFDRGFLHHAVSVLPYRGRQKPLALLRLVSSGGGNIPADGFLDDRTFLTTVIVADYFDVSADLPDHQLIFNAIGDADLCKPALAAAGRLIARSRAPVINRPSAVLKTSRVDNAKRLRSLPGVVTPRTLVFDRKRLSGPDGAAAIAKAGLSFPLLVRSPGFHTGRNFVHVADMAEFADEIAKLPGDDLLLIEYLDARGRDGNARKYRAMIVDGEVFPLHLAISRQWKVHYFTADMADNADHRNEEAAYLADMRSAIGGKAVDALARIAHELGLDYAGIDFGISTAGDVLLFEANATMVIAQPDADARWDYRRASIRKILDAVDAMIKSRAGATVRRRGRDG
jgi:glutathione synthase/RimK-type ligase-like ATP-grasp enzyme